MPKDRKIKLATAIRRLREGKAVKSYYFIGVYKKTATFKMRKDGKIWYKTTTSPWAVHGSMVSFKRLNIRTKLYSENL